MLLNLKNRQAIAVVKAFAMLLLKLFFIENLLEEQEKVHSWFEKRGLNPVECSAIVAFPEFTNNNEIVNKRLLDQINKVGNAFDVEIVEIKDFTPK